MGIVNRGSSQMKQAPAVVFLYLAETPSGTTQVNNMEDVHQNIANHYRAHLLLWLMRQRSLNAECTAASVGASVLCNGIGLRTVMSERGVIGNRSLAQNRSKAYCGIDGALCFVPRTCKVYLRIPTANACVLAFHVFMRWKG